MCVWNARGITHLVEMKGVPPLVSFICVSIPKVQKFSNVLNFSDLSRLQSYPGAVENKLNYCSIRFEGKKPAALVLLRNVIDPTKF